MCSASQCKYHYCFTFLLSIASDRFRCEVFLSFEDYFCFHFARLRIYSVLVLIKIPWYIHTHNYIKRQQQQKCMKRRNNNDYCKRSVRRKREKSIKTNKQEVWKSNFKIMLVIHVISTQEVGRVFQTNSILLSVFSGVISLHNIYYKARN